MQSMSNQLDQNENPFMSMIAVLLSPTHYRLRKWSIDMSECLTFTKTQTLLLFVKNNTTATICHYVVKE